ncbi:RNA polymerase sigma factor [Parafrankia sp. EUN1f]|uniref:RNA polymerase sigma factor n=1 Tax=Parafrankia sp. EUN1f TaxID=102897 RepID=UPI0001C43969|nr:sigma-70 family RNA polymerase sigma factor [Parafrankia sp. EUN1f]EFC85912.1 RNA polymerase, sigma-24 subunit, ECF subfamily [Parafrankia sp. EUN1f]
MTGESLTRAAFPATSSFRATSPSVRTTSATDPEMAAPGPVALVEERFTGLVSAVGPRVLAFLARRVDPPADAADLLADVLMTAWRRVGDLPPDDDAAAAWLFGVARHTLANHRRSQTRRAALADRLRDHLATVVPAREALTGAAMADDVMTDEAVEVRAGLARLAEADRLVLTLSCWDDLTADEIAGVLRITPAAVRQRLSRARTRLRRQLDA